MVCDWNSMAVDRSLGLDAQTGNWMVAGDGLVVAAQRDVTPGQYICICITDTGMGMPKEVINRLRTGEGQDVFLLEGPNNTYRITPFDPAFEKKMEKAEEIKVSSRQLRGSIGEELEQDTSAFSGDNTMLLKFHGIYQQDDRDLRSDRLRRKLEPEPSRPRHLVTEPGMGYRFEP